TIDASLCGAHSRSFQETVQYRFAAAVRHDDQVVSLKRDVLSFVLENGAEVYLDLLKLAFLGGAHDRRITRFSIWRCALREGKRLAKRHAIVELKRTRGIHLTNYIEEIGLGNAYCITRLENNVLSQLAFYQASKICGLDGKLGRLVRVSARVSRPAGLVRPLLHLANN